MPKFNGKEISRELIAKGMMCETPEDLVKLAKENDIEMTKEEAEAYLAEMDDFNLDSAQLKNVAGGGYWDSKPPCKENYIYPHCHTKVCRVH